MNINSSYTGLYGLESLSTLEKLGTALSINKSSDDASKLIEAEAFELSQQSLSQSLDNMSSGIAMSTIAQTGVSSQKELLENIKIDTLKAMSDTTGTDGRKAIEKQINKYIEEYSQISDRTTYNGETLLKTSGNIDDELSIVGESSIIGMEKANTTSISDDMKSAMLNFSNDASSRDAFLDIVNSGIDKLSSYASDFGSAQNAMESTVKFSLATEMDLALAKSTIIDIDYHKEIETFSKTNLQSQIGFLVQTQANAVQNRTISLLS